LKDGKLDEALASANNAIAIDPASHQAHYIAAQIYAETDRTPQALDEYEKALRIDPRPLRAAVQLSRLHLVDGNLDKAATFAELALTMDGRSVEAQELLLRIHLARGETARAKDVAAALQKAPPTAATLDLIALVQLGEKNVEAARASYV